MGIDVNRERAIDLAVSQIEKQFGKGAIMKLGEDARRSATSQAISTGSLGARHRARRRRRAARPRRRDLRPGVVGQDHAGAAHHRRGAEARAASAPSSTPSTRSTSATRASSASSVEDLLISQPDNGEQALEIAETLVRSGAIDVLVIDSVAALVPRAEIEGDMGDPQMGLQARLMSQALRKLTGDHRQVAAPSSSSSTRSA